ncbi:MAG: hypothetical protein Q7S88_01335 [Candidatus Daviesbacteria bacterium]|nr:hypothetical protein [Candidatus Daviesbacteria bacterium]
MNGRLNPNFADPASDSLSNREEVRKTKPEDYDELSESGTMPDPELIEGETTLERAQDMGLYLKADEESPHALNIIKELAESQKLE